MFLSSGNVKTIGTFAKYSVQLFFGKLWINKIYYHQPKYRQKCLKPLRNKFCYKIVTCRLHKQIDLVR